MQSLSSSSQVRLQKLTKKVSALSQPAKKSTSEPRIQTNKTHKPKRNWSAALIRLILFSVFWYLFGILARMGVEAMEHHFTKALPADQLLDMKVTLPMVMGVLAMSVTQFIAKKTGYDQ